MTYDDIFAAYYSQYRAEADTPTSDDDEYKIGIPLANEAINRWANYDNTMWKELFTTAQLEADGELVLKDGITDYAAPDNMNAYGGYIQILNGGVLVNRVPIVEPNEAQFHSTDQLFAYFIGNPNTGYTLKFSKAPDTALVGMSLDYVYYKKPTMFFTGSDVTEMSNPYFIVHRMLAGRFRSSRNPYYNAAKSDAEDILRMMQLQNNSGSWANPWSVPDNSGSVWGA